MVVFFAFFMHAATPPFAARLSDTEPTLGARSKTAPASPFCPFATVTVFCFRWVVKCTSRAASLSPNVAKRAAYGRVTDSGFKKKAMKTTQLTIEASAPANVRPSSGSKTGNSGQLHRIDFRERYYNRGLSTAQVIDLLYHETPRFWELCQVVGKWVWIQFQCKQPRNVTAQLSQLGFHWNRRRQVWQHPCGQFRRGTWIDPRDKYPTFYPAD